MMRRADHLGLDQGNALIDVHYMQRLTLQRWQHTAGTVFSINLEPAEIKTLILPGTILTFGDLSRALTAAIIDISVVTAAPAFTTCRDDALNPSL